MFSYSLIGMKHEAYYIGGRSVSVLLYVYCLLILQFYDTLLAELREMYIYRNYISNNCHIRRVVDQWPTGIEKGIHWCPYLRHLQKKRRQCQRFFDALPFQVPFVIVLLQGISGTRVVHRCVHLSGGGST